MNLTAVENTTLTPVTNEHWKLFVTLISISAVCLFLTLTSYLLIWDKHKCQGWMQFSYLVALFLFNVVFIPALCPGMMMLLGSERNRNCFLLSVLNQFFFVSAKTWLLIISVDLFSTIRKMKLIARSSSKNMRRFAIYSVIGWTFPLAFVTTGILMNWKYREIIPTKTTDEGLWASFPDYGFLHCRIPNWFLWECFVFANCIFHVIMFLLISFAIFSQRNIARLQVPNSAVSISRASPLIMFLKLFIVVGLSWSYIAAQDLLRAGNINTKQNWGWHIFRCIFFLQGTFISVITMTNGRNLRYLLMKYPKLGALQNFLQASILIRVKQKLQKTSSDRKESLESCTSQSTNCTVVL